MLKQNLSRKEPGFTLVEVLVVIIVLGILLSLSYFAFNSWRDRVAESEVKSDLNGLYSGMESARNWNNGYPVLTQGTLFDGNATTKNIFTQSTNVQLIYYQGDAKMYCIDAISKVRPSISMFLNTANGNKEPKKGTCVGGEGSAPFVPGTWEAASVASVNWRSVTFGNGIFLAVTDTGSQRAMTSTDGKNWTPRTVPLGYWAYASYGNGQFVVMSDTQVMKSSDAQNWTVYQMPSNCSLWQSIIWGNGVYSAVCWYESLVASSSDAQNWTTYSRPAGSRYSIAYGDGYYATGGGGAIATSNNLQSWKENTVSGGSWTATGSGNGKLLALNSSGRAAVFNSSSNTWSDSSAPSGTWRSIAYGNGYYMAVADDASGKVISSTNGTSWSSISAPSGTFRSITYGNGKFVIVGQGVASSSK